jgi:hypothetical protein
MTETTELDERVKHELNDLSRQNLSIRSAYWNQGKRFVEFETNHSVLANRIHRISGHDAVFDVRASGGNIVVEAAFNGHTRYL